MGHLCISLLFTVTVLEQHCATNTSKGGSCLQVCMLVYICALILSIHGGRLHELHTYVCRLSNDTMSDSQYARVLWDATD